MPTRVLAVRRPVNRARTLGTVSRKLEVFTEESNISVAASLAQTGPRESPETEEGEQLISS